MIAAARKQRRSVFLEMVIFANPEISPLQISLRVLCDLRVSTYFRGPSQRAVPIAKYKLLHGGCRRPAYHKRKLPSGNRISDWLVVKFDSQSFFGSGRNTGLSGCFVHL